MCRFGGKKDGKMIREFEWTMSKKKEKKRKKRKSTNP
jgi:hypothetical protein